MDLTWRTEKRKIKDLKLFDGNPRKMSDKQAEQLLESLKKFNYVELIAIDQNNRVIAGNMRVQALKKLGRDDEEIEVRVPSRPLTEEEAREYLLRSNKNTGEWDYDLLANFSEEELNRVGFESEELDKIFDLDVDEDDFDADAEAEKIKEPKVKLGDLYQLGEHRLLCGDATKKEDVEKLMGGELADMVFTDPPYNVNYNYAKYVDGRKMKWKKIFNDNKSSEKYYQFLLDSFKNIYDFTKKEMSLYVCHATKTQWENWAAFKDSGFHFSQTIIWLKERFILGLGQDWHRIYEPILFGWKEKERHFKNKQLVKDSEFWNLERTDFEEELDLWYLNRDKAKVYEHPTQKPVRLPERAIKKNCPYNGIVLDLFGGSGSTLIACEQLNRRCYMMEIDPIYCQVIIDRWEQFTGQKAIKLN